MKKLNCKLTLLKYWQNDVKIISEKLYQKAKLTSLKYWQNDVENNI